MVYAKAEFMTEVLSLIEVASAAPLFVTTKICEVAVLTAWVP